MLLKESTKHKEAIISTRAANPESLDNKSGGAKIPEGVSGIAYSDSSCRLLASAGPRCGRTCSDALKQKSVWEEVPV